MIYKLNDRQLKYLRAVRDNSERRLTHHDLTVEGKGQKHWQKEINYLRKTKCIDTRLRGYVAKREWVNLLPNGELTLKYGRFWREKQSKLLSKDKAIEYTKYEIRSTCGV